MSAQKFSGIVYMIGATQTVGQKGSLKRSIVIDTTPPNSQYPSYLEVEFWNDRVNLLDQFVQGQRVQIDAYVDSRLHQKSGRWFTSVRGVNIQQYVDPKYGQPRQQTMQLQQPQQPQQSYPGAPMQGGYQQPAQQPAQQYGQAPQAPTGNGWGNGNLPF